MAPNTTVSDANVDNLSLVLHKAGDMRLEQTPLPSKPGKNGEYFCVFGAFD